MKKLIKISAILSALFLFSGVTNGVRAEEACGDGGGRSKDIQSLSAAFDEVSGDITVDMALCAPPDTNRKTKYRAHFDHTAPFAPDPDSNGDTFINDDDICVSTDDDGMMHRANKDNGPGTISVAGTELTYVVNMAELDLDLEIGDTILVWADIQNKGIKDRAPDTNASDGCDKPEVAGEYIELELAPPTGCAAGDRYEDQGDGTVLDCSTDLVWLKDASCADLAGTIFGGRATWVGAKAAAAALADGTCGLMDGSAAEDWRLPTISEFCRAFAGSSLAFTCPATAVPDSLINSNFTNPAVSNTAGTGQWIEGDPFVGVQSTGYWSATENDADTAFGVGLNVGLVNDGSKTMNVFVWPVRDGQ